MTSRVLYFLLLFSVPLSKDCYNYEINNIIYPSGELLWRDGNSTVVLVPPIEI